jgi:hypothetical protein
LDFLSLAAAPIRHWLAVKPQRNKTDIISQRRAAAAWFTAILGVVLTMGSLSLLAM